MGLLARVLRVGFGSMKEVVGFFGFFGFFGGCLDFFTNCGDFWVCFVFLGGFWLLFVVRRLSRSGWS